MPNKTELQKAIGLFKKENFYDFVTIYKNIEKNRESDLSTEIYFLTDKLFTFNEVSSDFNFKFIDYILNNDIFNLNFIAVLKIFCIKLIVQEYFDIKYYEDLLIGLETPIKKRKPELDSEFIKNYFIQMRINQTEKIVSKLFL